MPSPSGGHAEQRGRRAAGGAAPTDALVRQRSVALLAAARDAFAQG